MPPGEGSGGILVAPTRQSEACLRREAGPLGHEYSALKNEPTAQLRQYIQDYRLDSLKVYYIILTIILYSNN